MWAYAQRDGRRQNISLGGALCSLIPFLVPMYHAAKFVSRPLLECHAVTLPIHENTILGRKVSFAPDKIQLGDKSQ